MPMTILISDLTSELGRALAYFFTDNGSRVIDFDEMRFSRFEASDERPEDRGDMSPLNSPARSGEDREGDPVLGAGVPVEDHRYQDDDVTKHDRDDGLAPAHALLDEPSRQHIGRHADDHTHPERGHGHDVPVALTLGDRSDVFVNE